MGNRLVPEVGQDVTQFLPVFGPVVRRLSNCRVLHATCNIRSYSAGVHRSMQLAYDGSCHIPWGIGEPGLKQKE